MNNEATRFKMEIRMITQVIYTTISLFNRIWSKKTIKLDLVLVLRNINVVNSYKDGFAG